MGGLFSMDGILYKFGTMVFDMFFLNLLWFICSIPIVTAGASTTALFYVCGKKVRGEEGYIFKEFFKSFKMNFKQSTIVWLMVLLAAFILWVDFKSISLLGGMRNYFAVLLLAICFECVITLIYIFPMLSKFYIKTGSLIKTAFFMANKHIVTTIACVLIAIGITFVLFQFSFFMFFMFAAYAYLTSFLFDRVFKKYSPEDDEEEEGIFHLRD